jgi:hypothetical protein
VMQMHVGPCDPMTPAHGRVACECLTLPHIHMCFQAPDTCRAARLDDP